MQGETKHIGNTCYQPVAWSEGESDSWVGWQPSPWTHGLTPLRGTSHRHHDQRQRPFQVWHVGQTGRRGRFRLGLLWVARTYPLLRQVRLFPVILTVIYIRNKIRITVCLSVSVSCIIIIIIIGLTSVFPCWHGLDGTCCISSIIAKCILVIKN